MTANNDKLMFLICSALCKVDENVVVGSAPATADKATILDYGKWPSFVNYYSQLSSYRVACISVLEAIFHRLKEYCYY